MVNDGEILQKWLDDNKMSANQLALSIGLTRQNLYYHLKQEKISEDFKNRLSLNGYDIFNVKNGKILTNIKKPQANGIALTNLTIMEIPLIPIHARAGYLTGYGDQEYIEELPTIPIIVDKQYKGEYRAFEVKGDSMNDGTSDSYISGDIAIGRNISKDLWHNKLHIKKWDFIIVHKEEGIIIKQIVKHDIEKKVITIHSLNSDFPDEEISLNDVLEIYNVVKVERDKKRY